MSQRVNYRYLRACGLTDDLFPEAHVRKALRTIYENNVLKFANGKMGAVNGYLMSEKGKPGHVDESSLQSMEMWTGVTYGVAALMIFEGETAFFYKRGRNILLHETFDLTE